MTKQRLRGNKVSTLLNREKDRQLTRAKFGEIEGRFVHTEDGHAAFHR